MSKYFVDQPSPTDILGERREVVSARSVGVEFGPSNAIIYLQVTGRGLVLMGDDSFQIAPVSTNHLEIIPNESHQRKSRIVEKQHYGGDLRDAKLALEHLQGLASEVDMASSVRKAAQRENLSAHIRSCIRSIQRVI